MPTERLTTASAIIGARTARACEGCMIRRARWFCASDDAFLCHSCDASVHSANQLASRHERVRISSTTAAEPSKQATTDIRGSDWHHKAIRRARTPRSNGVKPKSPDLKEASSLVVPETGFDEELICENDVDEDLMACQVPDFDENCHFWNEDESTNVEELQSLLDLVSDDIWFNAGDEQELTRGVGVDFVCDVDELETLDSINGNQLDVVGLEIEKNTRLKMEDNDDDEIVAASACQYDTELIDSGSRETLLDCDFGFVSDEMVVKDEEGLKRVDGSGSKQVLLLKLNFNEVVSAWDDHGCPWMTGTRPVFNPIGDAWPQFSVVKDLSSGHGGAEDENGGRSASEERVARVSRYREKRRSRLFSKKIRYEVRKLNAEKRPRMKGRFCKRV